MPVRTAEDAPALIAVDWGTTSFRAFLLSARGAILDRRDGPFGILAVDSGGFADVLRRETAGWAAGGALPILLSGMIGSRQGWIETPYLDCPAALPDLAAGLIPVPVPIPVPDSGSTAKIIPGIVSRDGGMPDVIRGEEVQIFGALAKLGADSGSFLLPGTHSKWVGVEAGRIRSFRTYMTGEIFAACRSHTILGRLIVAGEESPEAFLQGAREGSRPGAPGALLNRLFGVRTAGLFGLVPPAGLADYLSGILIGAELADAAARRPDPVQVIGAQALASRYLRAASELGIDAAAVDPDCIAAGYIAIAEAAGLFAAVS